MVINRRVVFYFVFWETAEVNEDTYRYATKTASHDPDSYVSQVAVVR